MSLTENKLFVSLNTSNFVLGLEQQVYGPSSVSRRKHMIDDRRAVEHTKDVKRSASLEMLEQV